MGTLSTKPMPPRVRFFFSRIFPLIFVIAGASVACFGIHALINAKASTGWPTANGVVVASSVEQHRSNKSGSSSSKLTYHAEILYEFSVNETTYNGNRVAFGDYGSSNPAHARRIVNAYPQGKRVAVYFMPDDPETCLLEPGIKMQSWFLAGFGLIFLIVGLFMAVVLPKAMNK